MSISVEKDDLFRLLFNRSRKSSGAVRRTATIGIRVDEETAEAWAAVLAATGFVASVAFKDMLGVWWKLARVQRRVAENVESESFVARSGLAAAHRRSQEKHRTRRSATKPSKVGLRGKARRGVRLVAAPAVRGRAPASPEVVARRPKAAGPFTSERRAMAPGHPKSRTMTV